MSGQPASETIVSETDLMCLQLPFITNTEPRKDMPRKQLTFWGSFKDAQTVGLLEKTILGFLPAGIKL